jgi:cysteine desulfurase
MRHYLDHNATSPLRQEARAALQAAHGAPSGNASSIHEEGRAARALLDAARVQVAALAGAPPRDVVFTSGGSEAIAAAARGVADRAASTRRRIVVSAIEHSAVLECARALSRQGFEVVEVPCEPTGRIDAEAFAERLDDRTALACLQAANNETGVVEPVAEVGASCRAAGVPFLVDAVQAAGKFPIDRDGWSADLLALSSHKLGGPQGAGALIVRESVAMAPLIYGGAQERRRRGGTEAIATISAFAAACGAAQREIRDETARLLALRDRLESALRSMAPGVRIHGGDVPRLANTVNAAFPGVSGETLVIALDLAGFAASTGSACASGAVTPSHVIRAMGFGDDQARGAVRFSLGWDTTGDTIDALLAVLPQLLARATMTGR